LVALYKVSDVVWACYSPEYDQSSGELGRALQYKKAVIVRARSIAENLAANSECLVITLCGEDYHVVELELNKIGLPVLKCGEGDGLSSFKYMKKVLF
jgi:hypothetical protein